MIDPDTLSRHSSDRPGFCTLAVQLSTLARGMSELDATSLRWRSEYAACRPNHVEKHTSSQGCRILQHKQN